MLRTQRNRNSTRQNYYRVWRIFNNFILSLDRIPRNWEDKLTLFAGYLVNEGKKSQTIKSYVSAIKSVLLDIKVEITPDEYLLSSLTRSCKLINDHVKTRLPIHRGQLNMLLNKANEIWQCQPYLKSLNKALLVSAYYGLLRVSELTYSPHAIKAIDVQIGVNKKKILFILRSSKTHSKDEFPQMVKIAATPKSNCLNNEETCPFMIIGDFLARRGTARNSHEQFFTFSDRSPVKPEHMHKMLCKLLIKTGYDPNSYSTHSMRIGRSCDLLKLGFSVETIKKLGRWKSNTVFKYLRNF